MKRFCPNFVVVVLVVVAAAVVVTASLYKIYYPEVLVLWKMLFDFLDGHQLQTVVCD